MFESPVIDERIKEIAPGFRAMSIHVDATNAGEGSLHTGLLTDACDYVLRGGPAWADAHLTSWADAYTRFGAKPNRTPCSAQALRKRVLKDGMIPSINPIVDLYNAVSLKYAIPVGGENYDAYAGRPLLTVADGRERFETVMNGEVVIENPFLERSSGETMRASHAGVGTGGRARAPDWTQPIVACGLC